jgi:iron(III) transport system permease protein
MTLEMTVATQSLPLNHRHTTLPWLRLAAWAAAAVALVPLIAVVVLAITRPGSDAMSPALIGRYAATSAALSAMVAVGSVVLGVGAAWLVVMHHFPGRTLFSWALVLPLAAPSFAIAYGYADLLDVAGPLRMWLRDAAGFDLPFEVRSLPGAAIVLSFAFYPYVYLTARAAFLSQSVCALEAGRTLGASPFGAFWRVALPMARPAIAAGAALAVMETLADYGAVQFLGVQTLTTGVVRAWSVFGAPASAAQLSLVLIGAAGLLLWLERAGRQGSFGANSARWRALIDVPLTGWRGWLASAACLAILTVGLLLPAAWLGWTALQAPPEFDRLGHAAMISFFLAAAGALVTVLLAAVIAFGAREGLWIKRLVSLGYATPGAVMAIGLLAPAALIWKGFGAAATGAATGLSLLVLAYAARLMASALGPIESGLARVTPSMERAARTLGETENGALARVHAPLAKGAIWTAAILVFLDVLKELPATLILRPFNFDTLAVLADRYAADERLAQAAWPALIIVVVAVIPTVLLSGRVAASRPGTSR